MGAMPHLRIADLLANAPIDPEAHLDAVRVERYAQMLDALPPIVVFDTPEGLLLVELCRLRHRPRRAQHRSGLPRPLAAGDAEDRSRDEALNASEELFSQRYDDAPWTPHVAEPVQVLVLGHFAEEFGAVGAHASDSVLDAFDCKHDAPEAQRVRRCDRRFDLDQFWIAKLRQLKPPVPIWGPHHND